MPHSRPILALAFCLVAGSAVADEAGPDRLLAEVASGKASEGKLFDPSVGFLEIGYLGNAGTGEHTHSSHHYCHPQVTGWVREVIGKARPSLSCQPTAAVWVCKGRVQDRDERYAVRVWLRRTLGRLTFEALAAFDDGPRAEGFIARERADTESCARVTR